MYIFHKNVKLIFQQKNKKFKSNLILILYYSIVLNSLQIVKN